MSKTKRILSLILSVSLIASIFTFSAGAVDTFEKWAEGWEDIENSSGYITLTPGADETQMNFSWQSSFANLEEQIMVGKAADLSDGEFLEIKNSLNIFGFEWSHNATVTDLEAQTTYYYQYTTNKVPSEIYSFTTGADNDGTRVLFVTDAQIGRSHGSELEIYQNDTYGWTNTLDTALKYNEDIDFILSGGDQVQDSYSEQQYTYFESPSALRSYPVAAAIGNHEFYTTNYSHHFNNPNTKTISLFNWPAGKGYYFSYNDVLFIVLDSNNFVPTANRRVIKNACKDYPDAKWRVLMIHHSPYDAPVDSEFANQLARVTIVPFAEEFDIDIVLGGHDHFYSRSHMIKDGAVTGDASENGVYKNPEGILYITQNSSSGSNYSGFGDEISEFCNVALQESRRTYSIVDIVENKLTVKSYHTDNNELFDEVTIEKD